VLHNEPHGRLPHWLKIRARRSFFSTRLLACNAWTTEWDNQSFHPDAYKFTESAVILAAQDEWGACIR